MKATIFDIQRGSFVDGPGIRTTVFFKGCNLRCAWCHNPESQSPNQQILFYSDKCTGCGKCKKVCPNGLESCNFCGKCALFCPNDAREVCGREYSVDEVLTEILKDKAYYGETGGATFSGGESMLQIEFLQEILRKCKENGVHTAVDTAGHIPYGSFEKILPYTDLFLYDFKVFDSEKHKKFVGADNRLIKENLQKLLKEKRRVWVRIPIIPSVNDSVEEIKTIKDFIKANGGAEKIELLPYHALGEHKYSALGRKAQKFETPSEETMRWLKNL